jgi:hypothetical protein
VFVTSYDFLSSSNRVASADARLRLNQNWFASGQATASRTTALDGTETSGPAYDAQLSYNSRRASYFLSYSDRSPGFRATLGFIPRVDVRQAFQFARYTWFANRGTLVSLGPSLHALADWDYRGTMQDWDLSPGFGVELAGQTSFNAGYSETMERVAEIDFRRHATSISFDTEWLTWLSLNGSYRTGTGINYFPPSGVTPFVADSRRGSAGATVRPSPSLRLQTTYLYSRLADVFVNHIVRSRADYQFTRELSVRAIVDHSAVRPNEAVVTLERTKDLRADVLVTYLVNPWTAIYVGYTDAYENLAVEAAGDALRRTGRPTFSTGRQFFVKASYLIRR